MLPVTDGAQVGQDVAEQVARHHHVERLRLAHEVHRRRVHQQRARSARPGSPSRTASNTSSHRTMPYTWAFDLVMLRELLPRPLAGRVERGPEDALAAAAGEHARLDRDLVRACPGTAGRRPGRTRPRCSRGRPACRSSRASCRRSGHGTPANRYAGRRFTYWSNFRRIGSSSSWTVIVSGTSGRRRRRTGWRRAA